MQMLDGVTLSKKENDNLIPPSSSSFLTSYSAKKIKIIISLMIFISIFLIIFLSVYLTRNKQSSPSAVPSYYTWCVGNCINDKIVSTKSGVILMGGGTDVEAAFLWQIKNANGGDFVILRTSGADDYNPWVYNLSAFYGFPLNSVRTILFNDKSASNDNTILTYLNNSEAFFFAGGDQSLYISWWTNTPVQTILQSKSRNVTLGGTSAGCAILGGFAFTAMNDTITSNDSMLNPYDYRITLGPAFLKLPYLEKIITDTHFVARNRMGRMITFMSRILVDGGLPSGLSNYDVYGLGIDQKTAIVLNTTTGDSFIVGESINSTAYLCSGITHGPEVCVRGKPLTFTNVTCQRLSYVEGATNIALLSTLIPTKEVT